LSSWLHVVSMNATRDHARRLRPLRQLYPEAEPQANPGGDGQAGEEQLCLVRAIIGTFTWEDQRLFELRYGQGLSHKDIGAHPSASPAPVWIFEPAPMRNPWLLI
jgi:DNA-directed RNA polymerase specialized sigma24 family protein